MQTSRSILSLALVLAGALAASAQSSPLQFIAITPCRIVDTRNTGNPILGNTSQNYAIQGSQGSCSNIPATAAAYSLNVTVIPRGSLNYLTVWPSGEQQPVVSTLNSPDGRIKANAAIVGEGTGAGGAVSVYATDTTDVILDLDGYFAPADTSTLAFYPVAPCRIEDTRQSGQPLPGGQEADFPVSGLCGIPSNAAAYSLNFTAIPFGPLGYLTVWPYGQTQPTVSTLNSPTGTVVANAAMVGAGNSGKVAVYPTDKIHLIIDINGYYAPANSAPGGLSLFTLTPCRVLDTRSNGGQFSGTLAVNALVSPCGLPSLAQAVVVNATVEPPGPMGYLTLWPNGQPQPVASTLNAYDGELTSNLAVVPTSNGFVNAYASDPTQLLVDLFGYFALPSGNAALNGNYVFTFSGFNTGTPVMMAGSFVADGNGNITSGVLDYNDGTGEPVDNQNNPIPQAIGAGSVYSLNSNGLGTMTIVTNLRTYQFSVVIKSDGHGSLIQSDPASPKAYGSGAIMSNTPTSQWPLCGSNVALGFFGFDNTLTTRYSGAGAFQFDPTTCVDAENGVLDTNDGGALSPTLFAGAFNGYDSNASRGIAGITFMPGGAHHYAFYLISSSDHKTNQLVLVSTDKASQPAPLTLWSALQQASPPAGWNNSNLAGAAVAELNALDKNGAVDVTAGLFAGNGSSGNNCQSNYDTATFNFDENQGGTSSQQFSTGYYCVDKTTGRVKLKGFSGQFGKFPPVFYLIKSNQGFVVGTDPAVTSGYLEQQTGAPFAAGSVIGSHAGGTVAPITSAVTNTASWLFADGGGNINGTANTSGPAGPGQQNFTYTYTVDGTGRAVVQNSGSNFGILYVISPQKFVMLPTTSDPNPALSVFASAGAN